MFYEILIGLSTGAVLGITGAGGSVLAIPLMIIVLGYEPTIAMGLSLGLIAINTGIAFAKSGLKGELYALPIVAFSFFGMISAPLGSWVRPMIAPTWLMASFTLLVVLISARMLFKPRTSQQLFETGKLGGVGYSLEKASCAMTPTGFQLRPRCAVVLIATGLATGFLSGVFGVGGGFIIVPALMRITRQPITFAIRHSAAILFFISSAGALSYLWQQGIEPLAPYALPFISLVMSSLVGLMMVSYWVIELKHRRIELFFAILAITLSMAAAWQVIR
ncbi:MAG: sulfite exporter TauE/SafE family protein [Pseudomonadota bacterium]|nr:sulfite exporter TauE/SafE family protein [Pseudomonadota bacterium]